MIQFTSFIIFTTHFLEWISLLAVPWTNIVEPAHYTGTHGAWPWGLRHSSQSRKSSRMHALRVFFLNNICWSNPTGGITRAASSWLKSLFIQVTPPNDNSDILPCQLYWWSGVAYREKNREGINGPAVYRNSSKCVTISLHCKQASNSIYSVKIAWFGTCNFGDVDSLLPMSF